MYSSFCVLLQTIINTIQSSYLIGNMLGGYIKNPLFSVRESFEVKFCELESIIKWS